MVSDTWTLDSPHGLSVVSFAIYLLRNPALTSPSPEKVIII